MGEAKNSFICLIKRKRPWTIMFSKTGRLITMGGSHQLALRTNVKISRPILGCRERLIASQTRNLSLCERLIASPTQNLLPSSALSAECDYGRSTGFQPRRYFSIGISLRNVAALDISDEIAMDPLVQNNAIPDNLTQNNLIEEVSMIPEDAAIDVVESAIDDVLRGAEFVSEEVTLGADSVAATEAPVDIATEAAAQNMAPDITPDVAPAPDMAPVSELPATAPDTPMAETTLTEIIVPDPVVLTGAQEVVSSGAQEVASTGAQEVASSTINAANEPLNILSSTSVDPSLIPLPPLPPLPEIAIPAFEMPFAELGLNSWWPSGWVQWMLEHCHTTFGLPWWGSILLSAVVLRIVTFPLFVYSQKTVAKNSRHQQKFVELQQEIVNNQGNWQKETRAKSNMAIFQKATGYSPISGLKPAMVQAPVFMSVFIGIRGMVKAPVESMKYGGILWFPDLTIGDPYYILPLFNALSLLLQMELGVETMAAASMPKWQKWIVRAVPCIMFPFLCRQTGAIALYWSLSIWIAFAFKLFLNRQPAKKYFDIPKTHRPTEAAKLNLFSLGGKDFSFKNFSKEMKRTYGKAKRTKTAVGVEKTAVTMWRESGMKPAVKTYKYD